MLSQGELLWRSHFIKVFCVSVNVLTLSLQYTDERNSSIWCVFSSLLLWYMYLCSCFVFLLMIENKVMLLSDDAKCLTIAVSSVLDCTISLSTLSEDLFLCSPIMLTMHSAYDSVVILIAIQWLQSFLHSSTNYKVK